MGGGAPAVGQSEPGERRGTVCGFRLIPSFRPPANQSSGAPGGRRNRATRNSGHVARRPPPISGGPPPTCAAPGHPSIPVAPFSRARAPPQDVNPFPGAVSFYPDRREIDCRLFFFEIIYAYFIRRRTPRNRSRSPATRSSEIAAAADELTKR